MIFKIIQWINKRTWKYYFLKTKLKKLPFLNYPEKGDFDYQKNLIKLFNQKNEQSSFMTCPDLIDLLFNKFNPNDNFNFLDFGGEKIDFYLNLKKEFKNVNYFLYNQKSINDTFNKLKTELNYSNLNIIEKFDEIFKEKYDFVNFGSCIQYLDDYESILKEISNNSKYIFFSATHLYDASKNEFKKNIVVKQIMGSPKPFFLYFFNRRDLFSILEKENFKLMFERKNLTDDVNYKNFQGYLTNITYSDFLFLREKSI